MQPPIKVYPPRYCDGYVSKPWHEDTRIGKTFFQEMREERKRYRAKNKQP